MIKKTKNKKRKNPSPYRIDKAIEKDFKKDEIRYQLGYTVGLFNGMKEKDNYKSAYKLQAMLNFPKEPYFKGYLEGLENVQDHSKLIPKNKIRKYTEELNEEIRILNDKLYDLESDEV